MAPTDNAAPGLPAPVIARRRFLGLGAAFVGARALGSLAASGLPLAACAAGSGTGAPADGTLFRISLAQWSLHKALFAKELDNLDFPGKARRLGIDAVEYVNSFWKDKARDAAYLAELRRRCEGEGVRSVLIMCDGEGALGNPDAAARTTAIENHHKWIEAAEALGCHSIRVNAQSQGSYEEQQKLASDGLHRLCEYGDRFGIDVIVENHGGLSSNGRWLSETLAMADHPRCGSLPDFGNFRISKDEEYDRYRGIDELMPFARGVSAKSHDFDAGGDETHTDYRRMLDIVVRRHGYHGFIGIEYEGGGMAEDAGIAATKTLLERVRTEMQERLA